jgi:hypothetical protein
MNTTARWEGPVLIVNFSGSRNGRSGGFEERWSLSPDGKTIKLQRHLAGPMGQTEQSLVLAKQ